jgi:uncharacterized protein (TIGR00251 family)
LTQLDLRSDSEGTSLGVRVKPRARKSEVAGLRGGVLEVAVAAPPVDGEANHELVRFLAHVVGIPRSKVRLLTGETGRRKVVRFDGVEPQRLLRALGIDETALGSDT